MLLRSDSFGAALPQSGLASVFKGLPFRYHFRTLIFGRLMKILRFGANAFKFEGGAERMSKKRNFLVQMFGFLFHFACGAETFGQIVFTEYFKSSESQFGLPKKRSTKFLISKKNWKNCSL